MKNFTKEKMQRGERTIGTFFELASTNAAEALSYSNLDYIIIDTEHGPYSEDTAQELIRATKGSRLTSFVRIKEVSRAAVLKMLDIGAEGLIVPCIDTVDQVKDLVKWGKYTPVGQRGFFFGRVAGYGFEDFTSPLQDYFDLCNRETMIIPQCETAGSLENIEEIASIDGVDGIFIGPYDLSIALGAPGEFDTDDFKNAINRIIKACEAANKPVMIYAGGMEAARNFLDMGIDSITYSMDLGVLTNSYIDLVEKLSNY